MNLRDRFLKRQEIERSIADPFPVLILSETPDGGKAGVVRVVPRQVAADLLLEGNAVMASAEEAEAHREGIKEEVRLAKEAEAAKHVQIAIVSSADLQAQLANKKQSSPVTGK